MSKWLSMTGLANCYFPTQRNDRDSRLCLKSLLSPGISKGRAFQHLISWDTGLFSPFLMAAVSSRSHSMPSSQEHLSQWTSPWWCFSINPIYYLKIYMLGKNMSLWKSEFSPCGSFHDPSSSVCFLSPGNSTAIKEPENLGHTSGMRCW